MCAFVEREHRRRWQRAINVGKITATPGADRQQSFSPAFVRRRAATKRMIELNNIPLPTRRMEGIAALKPQQTTARSKTAIADIQVDVTQQGRELKAQRRFRVADLCRAYA